MPQIRVPVRDILTDPDNPTDLTTVSQEKVVKRLRELYSFLPSIEAISIVDDVAVISTMAESPYRIEEAESTYKRAGRAAERGNYRAALEMLQEALEVILHHAETHRDLSMAYYELGDSQEAKRHIVQALRLQPTDAWSWVVLGNIYLKFENDAEQAERCCQKAYELDPTDLYLLNSYGALKAKRGQYAEARDILEQAIQQDPNYPNSRYGLALCYVEEGDLETALLVIEETCPTPRPQDMRSEPVEAIDLYPKLPDVDSKELTHDLYVTPLKAPDWDGDLAFEAMDYVCDLIEDVFSSQPVLQERPLTPEAIAAELVKKSKFEPLRAVYYGGKPISAEQFVRECMDWDCRPIPFGEEGVLAGRRPKRVDVLHERFFRFDGVNRDLYGWTGRSSKAQANIFLTLAEQAEDKTPFHRWVARLISLPEEAPDIEDPEVRAGLRELIGDVPPYPYVVME